jgi:hypothetical protein
VTRKDKEEKAKQETVNVVVPDPAKVAKILADTYKKPVEEKKDNG